MAVDPLGANEQLLEEEQKETEDSEKNEQTVAQRDKEVANRIKERLTSVFDLVEERAESIEARLSDAGAPGLMNAYLEALEDGVVKYSHFSSERAKDRLERYYRSRAGEESEQGERKIEASEKFGQEMFRSAEKLLNIRTDRIETMARQLKDDPESDFGRRDFDRVTAFNSSVISLIQEAKEISDDLVDF